MRTSVKLSIVVIASVCTLSLSAADKDLFEAKTATKAIKDTSQDILSSASAHERRAKRNARKANRRALKAYKKCPERAHVAERSLSKAQYDLVKFEARLSTGSAQSAELTALADFANATIDRIEMLLTSGEVCDTGTTLSQFDDLDYSIDPAPFVNFASAWGTLFSSAHGTFGEFAPQSAAPDHVHSATYYGVVIQGIVKNPFGAMPNGEVATAKALPPGSFWSVPANAIHTTACDAGADNNCLFYFHSRDAFDFSTDVSDGDAMNTAAQEISVDEIAVELTKPDAIVSPFARMVTLWGNRHAGAHGTIGEFIPGSTSPLHTHTVTYHGVVLSGTIVNPFFGNAVDTARQLQAGDYWFVPAGVEHVTACVSDEPCTFYFHSEGLFDFLPVEID